MTVKIGRDAPPSEFLPRETRLGIVGRLFDGIQQPVRDAFASDSERIPFVDRVIADVVNSTGRWTLAVDEIDADEEPSEGDQAAASLKRGRWR